MPEQVETRYATTLDGAYLAYQVVGRPGGPNLVLDPHSIPIDLLWDNAELAAAIDRLATFCRVILFDFRGVGASDAPVNGRLATAEESMADVMAVMDAADCGSAFLISSDEIAKCVLQAVTHPDRVEGLILLNGYARLAAAPDYPFGLPTRFVQTFIDRVDDGDLDESFDLWCAGRADDLELRRWYLKCLRASASPHRHRELLQQSLDTDARDLLPLVQVRTLVLHSRANPFVRVGHGRYLAERIAGARLVELDGAGHLLAATDLDQVVDAIEEFVTGSPPTPQIDRVFATVLFSDIVDSTARATDLGDRRWRTLLDRHDALVDRQLKRFRGRLVKTTGDGVLACFDGPARAILCALAIRDGLRRIELEVRIGLHAGEVEPRGEDLSGIAVHVAARVQAHAGAGEVFASRTVVDLVAGSGISFEDRGEHPLKGVAGEWRLFAVTGQ